jgi:hypothetical protein
MAEDRAIHSWYRFVLSFPPHLVRGYLQRFRVTSDDTVLDPFCGTGTTLVECKKQGIPSVGVEALPMASFASRVKVDWTPDSDGLTEHARTVAGSALAQLERDGVGDVVIFATAGPQSLRCLPAESQKLLLKGSISPVPLHRTLVLLDSMERLRDDRYYEHERLALASALVASIGNLHFGPEVGASRPRPDAAVVGPWLSQVKAMASDLRAAAQTSTAPAAVHDGDARRAAELLPPESISAVITSPPYPNEKDYTRICRLESVLLGFVAGRGDLQALKRNLIRSNTRSAYKDDADDVWAADQPEVQRLAEEIERRRLQLGKTSGFERMYSRLTKLYFGGMARHLADLRSCLRRNAQLAYVVGDQASYLRVMIRTGQVLGDIARGLGYELVGRDLFRTRLATATREHLREEVLLLRWPG